MRERGAAVLLLNLPQSENSVMGSVHRCVQAGVAVPGAEGHVLMVLASGTVPGAEGHLLMVLASGTVTGAEGTKGPQSQRIVCHGVVQSEPKCSTETQDKA